MVADWEEREREEGDCEGGVSAEMRKGGGKGRRWMKGKVRWTYISGLYDLCNRFS